MLELEFEHHAIVRARQHFQIELIDDDLAKIIDMIKRKLSLKSGVYSAGTERHMVRYQNTVLPVVFNPKTEKIITILPECRHNHHKAREKLRRQRRATFPSRDRRREDDHTNSLRVFDHNARPTKRR